MNMMGGSFLKARESNGRFIADPCPPDFETVFVQIGRLACEEHYRAPSGSCSRETITRWLNECGKEELIAKRAAHVRQQRKGMSNAEMSAILTKAFPIRPTVSFTLARHAAQHIRSVRNGGWVVSPTKDGQWWVGARRRSAAWLLEFAISKGFDPANLRGETHSGLDCEPQP